MSIGEMLMFTFFYAGGWYLGLRAVRALEKWVEYYGKRKENSSTTGVFSPTASTPVAERQEAKAKFEVPQLAPEVIAPNLGKPTRVSGFGSGAGDRDGQSGSEKTQSPEDCKPKTDGKPPKV